MLEIKNPISRIITGVPLDSYWIQTQVQMEVCDLNACDFLEARFTEYASYEAFLADGGSLESEDGCLKGRLWRVLRNGASTYAYPPFQATDDEIRAWESTVEGEWIHTHYWKLEQVECTLIERNPEWFAAALPKFADVWSTILEERASGAWSARLPKKRGSMHGGLDESHVHRSGLHDSLRPSNDVGSAEERAGQLGYEPMQPSDDALCGVLCSAGHRDHDAGEFHVLHPGDDVEFRADHHATVCVSPIDDDGHDGQRLDER